MQAEGGRQQPHASFPTFPVLPGDRLSRQAHAFHPHWASRSPGSGLGAVSPCPAALGVTSPLSDLPSGRHAPCPPRNVVRTFLFLSRPEGSEKGGHEPEGPELPSAREGQAGEQETEGGARARRGAHRESQAPFQRLMAFSAAGTQRSVLGAERGEALSRKPSPRAPPAEPRPSSQGCGLATTSPSGNRKPGSASPSSRPQGPAPAPEQLLPRTLGRLGPARGSGGRGSPPRCRGARRRCRAGFLEPLTCGALAREGPRRGRGGPGCEGLRLLAPPLPRPFLLGLDRRGPQAPLQLQGHRSWQPRRRARGTGRS